MGNVVLFTLPLFSNSQGNPPEGFPTSGPSRRCQPSCLRSTSTADATMDVSDRARALLAARRARDEASAPARPAPGACVLELGADYLLELQLLCIRYSYSTSTHTNAATASRR